MTSLSSATQLPRRPRTALVAMATTGTWKDGERAAQFVANVLGGVFVVVGVSSYVVTVIQNAAAVTPSMGDYFRARASELGAQFHINMTAPQCAQSTSGLVAIVLDCLDASDVSGGGSEGLLLGFSAARLSLAMGLILLLGFVLANVKWVAWYCWLQLGVIIQWIIAVYQMLRISLSMTAYLSVKIVKHVAYSMRFVNVMVFGIKTKHAASLKQLMKQAVSFAQWQKMAEYLTSSKTSKTGKPRSHRRITNTATLGRSPRISTISASPSRREILRR
jgi:hypothetical protein